MKYRTRSNIDHNEFYRKSTYHRNITMLKIMRLNFRLVTKFPRCTNVFRYYYLFYVALNITCSTCTINPFRYRKHRISYPKKAKDPSIFQCYLFWCIKLVSIARGIWWMKPQHAINRIEPIVWEAQTQTLLLYKHASY